MLTHYNPIDVEIALHQASPQWPPFPPASDHTAWQTITGSLDADERQRLIRNGEEAAATPVPRCRRGW